jgi:nucleoside-triphosphatase
MHLFLTGEIQVGKSTIINKAVQSLGRPVGGFRTVAGNYAPDGSSDIFIISTGDKMNCCNDSNRVAHRTGVPGKGFTTFPQVFDTVGASLLRRAGEYPLIIMDELGFMESRALEFQKAVFERLDEDVPVLGVVKPMKTDFLDRIRAHEKVNILSVDVFNREDVLKGILDRMPY